MSPFGAAHSRRDPAHFPRTNDQRRQPRAKAPSQPLPVTDDGWATCPECQRTWLVVAVDDVYLPACGHFGTDWGKANRNRPCVPCGLKHERGCPDCSLLAEEPDEWPQWSPGTEHSNGKGKK